MENQQKGKILTVPVPTQVTIENVLCHSSADNRVRMIIHVIAQHAMEPCAASAQAALMSLK